jgi:hypothetical protein
LLWESWQVASVSLLSFPDGNIVKSQLIGSPKHFFSRKLPLVTHLKSALNAISLDIFHFLQPRRSVDFHVLFCRIIRKLKFTSIVPQPLDKNTCQPIRAD